MIERLAFDANGDFDDVSTSIASDAKGSLCLAGRGTARVEVFAPVR